MDIHVYILSLSSHTCLVTLSILCIHVHVYIIDQVSTCLLGITCEMTVGVTWTWSYTSCISSFIEQVVTRGLAKKRLWRIPQARRQSKSLIVKSSMKEITQKENPHTVAEAVNTNPRGTAKESKRNCSSSSTCCLSARLNAIVSNDFALNSWHVCTPLLGQALAGSLTSLHNSSSNEYLFILPCPLNTSLYYGIQPQTGHIYESNGIYASINNIVIIFMIHSSTYCIVNQVPARTSRGIGKKPRLGSCAWTEAERRCLTTSWALRHVAMSLGTLGIMANSRKTNAKSLIPTPSCIHM